ncbi:MAG: hypothetical protein K0R61_68 [Microvirga sp.]|jgi:hypothetical protein|nr:hypothetical protein [Microvirga sp.]MDF2969618.1 hypothetical protein [Microvirga sp.]
MGNIKNLSMKGGTDRTFTLYARDDDNAVLSLSAATISLRVGRPPACKNSDWPVLTVTGAVVSAALGTFTAAFTASATQYMAGDYYYEAWVTISAALQVGVDGRFRVLEHITS